MNINPTVFYIGLIVLVLATLAASYFKVLPEEITITIVSAILGTILGHSITLASVRSTIQRLIR